jgi:hypothetical protein
VFARDAKKISTRCEQFVCILTEGKVCCVYCVQMSKMKSGSLLGMNTPLFKLHLATF